MNMWDYLREVQDICVEHNILRFTKGLLTNKIIYYKTSLQYNVDYEGSRLNTILNILFLIGIFNISIVK